MEALAAITVLRDWTPDLKVRFVNVVDLFTLETPGEHPHGIQDEQFDRLFTRDKPVIFAFHGYPTIVHKLTYKRHNHDNFHVHGFIEQGHHDKPVRHDGAEQAGPLYAGAGRGAQRATHGRPGTACDSAAQ